MKFIKSIKFYFNTIEEVLEVHGEEAQQLFDHGELEEEVITVSINGVTRLIPRSSILYIEIYENQLANEIYKDIRGLHRALTALTGYKVDWSNLDIQDGKIGWIYSDGRFEPRNELSVTPIRQIIEKLFELEEELQKALVGEVK